MVLLKQFTEFFLLREWEESAATLPHLDNIWEKRILEILYFLHASTSVTSSSTPETKEECNTSEQAWPPSTQSTKVTYTYQQQWHDFLAPDNRTNSVLLRVVWGIGLAILSAEWYFSMQQLPTFRNWKFEPTNQPTEQAGGKYLHSYSRLFCHFFSFKSLLLLGFDPLFFILHVIQD